MIDWDASSAEVIGDPSSLKRRSAEANGLASVAAAARATISVSASKCRSASCSVSSCPTVMFLRISPKSLAVGYRRCITRASRRVQRFAGFWHLARESGDPSMPGTPLEALDLAALLCSRVCHDLISPVGAIVNGLEVMQESKDEETKNFALDLISKSSRNACAKLQFCRLAFGAAGAGGARIDTGAAETMARGFLEDDKTKLTWNLPRTLQPKNRVKLLLNMLILAQQAIPRGGTLAVEATGEGDKAGIKVRADGLNARVPQNLADLLAGNHQ